MVQGITHYLNLQIPIFYKISPGFIYAARTNKELQALINPYKEPLALNTTALMALTTGMIFTALLFTKNNPDTPSLSHSNNVSEEDLEEIDEKYNTANMERIPATVFPFIDNLPKHIHIQWPTLVNPQMSITVGDTRIFKGTLQELQRILALLQT